MLFNKLLISISLILVAGSLANAGSGPAVEGSKCVIQGQLIECSCKGESEAYQRQGQSCRDDRVGETHKS